MQIERLEVVSSEKMRIALWQMYSEIFEPLNAETPIMQSLLKNDFFAALTNPQVIKYIAMNDSTEPIGIAMITTDMTADPFVSLEFFKKHFHGRKVYYILTIGVKKEWRGVVATQLVLRLTDEIPTPDGMGVLLHSEKTNNLIPRFAQRVRPGITRRVLDREACIVFEWNAGNNMVET